MTADPLLPGRYAKGIVRRESILEAAHAVFGRAGYNGASLREIARECGVSVQALVHYFPTKDALLIAVLRRRDERLRSHFQDAGGMSVEELIALAEDNVHSPGVIELFSMAAGEATSTEHPAYEYYADYYRQIIESCSRFLLRAEQKGVLAPGMTATTASRIMLGAMDGLQLQWLYARDAVFVADTLRSLLGLLVTVPLEHVREDSPGTDK